MAEILLAMLFNLFKMPLVSILLPLLVSLTPVMADPGCLDPPAHMGYPDGMRWCGRYDSPDNYLCKPAWDSWCRARHEAWEAVHILCNGEWAHAIFEPWENKYKCWPLHFTVVQGRNDRRIPMHVMFRMKNNRGHAEELDPETCSRSF